MNAPDQNGQPVNGTVEITYRLFDTETGGTALYSEAEDVTVTDGMFNSVVGPTTVVAGLAPEDLAKELFMEIQVANGVYTETLAPRQRLYGSPYAFTLMPGTVISGTMDTVLYGSGGVNAVTSIYNGYDGDAGNPALPALRVIGETGVELTSPTNDDGSIYSDLSQAGSDLLIYSQDNVSLYLDNDDNETGTFNVFGNTGFCAIDDVGDFSCTGTKSASVPIQDEQRLMYAMESPEVWFEDFGSDTLVNGRSSVTIEPLFAESVNLGADYHVFLTPLGDCNGLYVAEKSATGFTVRELNGGTADIAFDYRIVAKRTGYEDVRLEKATVDLEEK